MSIKIEIEINHQSYTI